MPSSDLSSLLRSFDVEATDYQQLVQRYEARLAERAAEPTAGLCDDVELLDLPVWKRAQAGLFLAM